LFRKNTLMTSVSSSLVEHLVIVIQRK